MNTHDVLVGFEFDSAFDLFTLRLSTITQRAGSHTSGMLTVICMQRNVDECRVLFVDDEY